jgi:hypothetical protein
MGTNNEEKRDKGQFVQFPLHLIYERKDLSRDDKWVLLSIMGTYWTEGPHRLSYREVAALSGVPLALLTSYLDKKTGKQHEGILDRLARTGDIRITQNKDTNPLTGQPRGQTQSYIWVNYTSLWEQNAAYCETRKSVPNTNASVPYTNASVSDTNASVPNVNRSVPYTNDSVSVLPSEVPPIDYIDITDKEDTEDKEESKGEQSNTATFAPSLSFGAAPSSQSDTFALPDGDYIIIERLPGGGQKIRRASSKPIGELIPMGMDTSEGLQNLVTVDAVLSLSENETQSQSSPIANSNTPLEGDKHALVATGTLLDANPARSALDRGWQAVGEVSDGKEQEITRTCGTCGRQQTQADCPWCMTTRLPAIPKQTPSLPPAVEPGRSGGPTPVAPAPLPGGTSHGQDRDAIPPRSVAVEAGPGADGPAPIPPVPPEVTPPRTMRATVVSPPPQVLVVSQQFTSVEDWKQAQETFVEQLRSIWKTAGADFKRQVGNWNAYRKQYLDRWLKANPEPLEVQFTPDGKTLFDEWCSLFKVKVDPIKANIEAANWLAEPCATWATLLSMPRTEVLRDEKDWLYANDKKGYYKRGVKLFDLKREFEGWQSHQQFLLDKAEREKGRPQNKYGTVSGLPHLEPSQEWLEAMGGR